MEDEALPEVMVNVVGPGQGLSSAKPESDPLSPQISLLLSMPETLTFRPHLCLNVLMSSPPLTLLLSEEEVDD